MPWPGATLLGGTFLRPLSLAPLSLEPSFVHSPGPRPLSLAPPSLQPLSHGWPPAVELEVVIFRIHAELFPVDDEVPLVEGVGCLQGRCYDDLLMMLKVLVAFRGDVVE
jgi:hypothetical protein